MSKREADWHAKVMLCSFALGILAIGGAAFCVHLILGLVWIGMVAIAFACAARQCQKDAEAKEGGDQ